MVREQPVGIPALVLLTALEALVVTQEADQLVAQVLVMETVLMMVVLVLVMVLEALEGHLMVLDQDQLVADPQMAMAVGMAQLVVQVLVTETVLMVGIPAPVLLMAPEALGMAVTVAQMMEQVTLVAAQVETAEMEAMAAELGLAEKAVRRS
jgi:hypothetical protein